MRCENTLGMFFEWSEREVSLWAKGLRTIYKNVATVLDLHPEDDFLEIGFGSGIFMRSYAAHVRSITGLDHSEDMVKLATKYNKVKHLNSHGKTKNLVLP
jgi:ubiquinone/menaquinone biosynthesis C-methylase UbiE